MINFKKLKLTDLCMIDISKAEIVDRIKNEIKLSEEEVEKKISDKITELEGLISETGAAHIIANELGVKLVEKVSDKAILKIANMVSGLRSISVLGRVIVTYPVTTFPRKKGQGKVGSMLIDDGTGKLRIVMWDEKTDILTKGKVNPGDIIKLTNVSVRENMKRLEAHTKKATFIEINPKDEAAKDIPQVSTITQTKKDLLSLNEGVHTVKGKIVQVFENNPFFEICKECLRRARYEDGKYVCKEHGAFDEPRYSMVLNTVIDDGTTNMRCVFFGRNAEKLIGMTVDDAHKIAVDTNDFFKPVRDSVKNFLGHDVIVRGTVSKNKMFDRVEIIAQNIYQNTPVSEGFELIKKLTQ